MKKYIFIFISFLFALSTSSAYAAATIPKKESDMIHNTMNSIESFRSSKYTEIIAEKDKTTKDITSMDKANAVKNEKILDATEGPIAHIKLYFLIALGFIFATSAAFYTASILLAFLILRFLYKRIRK